MTLPTLSGSNPKQHLVDRIQAIIEEDGCDIPTAVERVAVEMQEQSQYWIKELGAFLIIRVLGEQTGAGRPHLVANGKPNPSKKSLSGTSLGSVWDLLTPVGNTGTRKRFGDITEGDRVIIANMYRRLGETALKKSKFWESIKGILAKGETLEQAQARLPGTFLRFLRAEVGIKQELDEHSLPVLGSPLLVRCFECQQKTSADAVRCSHCGAVLNKRPDEKEERRHKQNKSPKALQYKPETS